MTKQMFCKNMADKTTDKIRRTCVGPDVEMVLRWL